jgi:preprotein translocase subunit SecG
MTTFLTILHVSACIMLILVVLIQAGKGADISASLGGSSQTVFGSSGGANFFTRFTGITAGVFMFTSISLTVFSAQNKKSVFESGSVMPASAPISAPAAPAAPTPETKAAAKEAPQAASAASAPAMAPAKTTPAKKN